MNSLETDLPNVYLLEPSRFGDARGWFSEVWNEKKLAGAGINAEFVQDNHSFSEQTGTVRGLHFQAPPHAQAKLVRVVCGSIFDVAVDLRNGSPHYGKWFGAELSAENGRQLYIPEGFLHGFITLKDKTEVLYKCTDYYAPETEGSVRFDDPDLNIDWGSVTDKAVLSDKDAVAPYLKDIISPFEFEADTKS